MRKPRMPVPAGVRRVPREHPVVDRERPVRRRVGRRPGPPAILVEQVAKTYEIGPISVRALRGVSLQIDRGDFVAIMGSSGSGKSTLMNILGCLDVPSAGRYEIDGIDVRDLDEDDLSDLRNGKIGFVFQSYNLVARTTALANVELPLAYAGVDRAARRSRAVQALTSVGMAERLHHQSSELSGGQQQRVAVARALVTNPTMILADEPTGNLDSRSTEDVLRIFARLNSEGRTIVLITHEPDVAEQARRVITLADGRIVEDRGLAGVHEPPPPLGERPVSPHLLRRVAR
jgi:putative ABC transport system ATP-binding protein